MVVRTVRGMSLNLGMVTIDSVDAVALAEFWTAALGVAITERVGDEYLILGDRAHGVRVALQRVAEQRTGKNRVHLDFGTDDRPAEVARLVGLGARELAVHELPGLSWSVLADPQGNEFCVAVEG